MRLLRNLNYKNIHKHDILKQEVLKNCQVEIFSPNCKNLKLLQKIFSS